MITRDTLPLLKDDERAIFRLRALYDRYGYARYKMSKFEEYDLYVRNKSFLLSDHIITFTDTTGKLMALKPDVTLSIVKNTKDSGGVQKLYYDENVYRIAKSGYGFREIMQVGLECIGDIDTYCLSEVLTLAAESLSLISEDFVLDVSHMGILSSVLDTMGANDDVRRALLQCVSEKNLHGIDALARKNGICTEAATRLQTLVSTYGRVDDVLPVLRDLLQSPTEREALTALCDVLSALAGAAWYDRIRLDFSVVNDLSYYNGFVFQGFVRDIPTAILSGGQYDLLMQKMGKRAGAVGFAVYPDALDERASVQKAYDTDAVILYDDKTDLCALRETVRAMTEEGLRVTAQRTCPEKLRYKRLLKMNESEVETLEDHA